MQNSIIEFIKINRVSTAEITDVMGKSGAISDLHPITNQIHSVGKVRWVYAYKESNYDFHMQIRDITPGEIVFVETFDCNDRAVFGSLVSKFLILYRQVPAIIVLGNVRDAHQLIKERYPIWAQGVTPIGCFNKEVSSPFDSTIKTERKETYDGTIAVCDDSGVVIIPKHYHTQNFLDQLIHMENQEDIWFDCIDRRKWNTFDTVCLKKYLTQ